MTTLIIDHRNVELEYENRCLLIRQPDEPVRSLPLARLQRILCMHGVRVDTALIGQCLQQGIDFIVLNQRHSDASFALHASHQLQAARRVAQYRYSSDAGLRQPLAQRLIRHKLALSLRTLRRQPHGPQRELALQRLQQQVAGLAGSPDADSLRGHEGVAQRQLFAYWQSCLPAELGFQGRQRQPPPDPVNALLSLTYTLVQQEAIRQCLSHGLDPWLGFHHELAPGRHSLACDLMEPLRPLIEEWVVGCLQDGEFNLHHFSQQNGNCRLGKAGRERYYLLWYRQLPAWSRRLSQYAALLARHLQTSGLEATPDA